MITHFNMDNFSATYLLTIDSFKVHLQCLAIDICFHCLRHHIKLLLYWIPREQNYDDYYYTVKIYVCVKVVAHCSSRCGSAVIFGYKSIHKVCISQFSYRTR